LFIQVSSSQPWDSLAITDIIHKNTSYTYHTNMTSEMQKYTQEMRKFLLSSLFPFCWGGGAGEDVAFAVIMNMEITDDQKSTLLPLN